MSKSTHLILEKLVLNDFHLKLASWDKIQKSLFQEVVLKNGVVDNTYESTKLLHRGVNDCGLEVSITFKHLRLAHLLMD